MLIACYIDNEQLAKKLMHLSSEMRTVRKVVRLVVTIELLRKLINSVRKLQLLKWHSKASMLSEYCALFGEVFGLLFHLYDHRVLLAEVPRRFSL